LLQFVYLECMYCSRHNVYVDNLLRNINQYASRGSPAQNEQISYTSVINNGTLQEVSLSYLGFLVGWVMPGIRNKLHCYRKPTSQLS